MNLGIPRSCGSAPSQEIEQVSHILVHAGFIHPTGGSYRLLPDLGIGPVSRPPCALAIFSPPSLHGLVLDRGSLRGR